MEDIVKTLSVIFGTAVSLLPVTGFAALISFSDPVGDHTGAVDVIGMEFDINAATGDYVATIEATAAAPFLGDFRINLNIWNVTLDEFFQDTFNDFSLGVSQTSIALSGTNADLTDWIPAHNIVTSTLAGFGNPSGSSFFRSSVADLPFQPVCQAEDIIGIDGCSQVAPAPAPAPLALLLTGLLGVVAATRRRPRHDS